jgi:hypothetical protein
VAIHKSKDATPLSALSFFSYPKKNRALSLITDQIAQPPVNEDAWFEERGRMRGVDFSRYK